MGYYSGKGKEGCFFMPYTHVLFDADDTLFDFQSGCRIALGQTVLALTGREYPDAFEVYLTHNHRWWDAFERGEVTMEQLSTGRFVDFAAAMDFDTAASPEQWRDEYQKNLGACTLMVDGARELCFRLKGQCRMYIVTNGIAAVQRDRMSRSEVRDCFEELFISQELGCRKPQREYFDIVLGRLGDVKKENILVVGDSLTSDVAGAAAAGLDVCWFNPQGKAPGELRPTYTISRLEQAESIILGK